MNYNDIDSPSLIILKDKVESNLTEMINIAGGTARLMPHIKTNKMEAVLKLMIEKGISRFKAATIAEAELAAMAGAKFVLISHQLIGPKIDRLKTLIERYPGTSFASLVDCYEGVNVLAEKLDWGLVYVDINNGMNRTGHEINEQLKVLTEHIFLKKNLKLAGLHIYDGHITDADFSMRKIRVEEGMGKLNDFISWLKIRLSEIELVCGGSPAFTAHVTTENRTLSPGTSIFWDWGYGDKYKEQHFNPAAFVLTRVISKPAYGIVTVDMGHKAISAENSIDFRVRFPDNPDLKLKSQSEEHGVLETTEWEKYKVGDILVGIPYHVCPTVNLYDHANVFFKNEFLGQWEILGRKRKITI